MKVFTIAPNFELEDYQNNLVQLTNYAGKKNIILVFLRGFM